MINQFKTYINKYNLLPPNSNVLCAISGGIDSAVMLDLISKTKIKFAIAHCNFELRGDESDKDEEFVRQLAKKYNVKLFVSRCNADNYSKSKGLSIQEAARELRYLWFNSICLNNHYSSIAIAHNQDDNIETFFINLFRGAGLKGLRSIPVKRDNIIRPLMFATRKQIVEYAKENNLEYREDSSNASDYYLRNNIRHNLIPKIADISPGFAKAIQKSISNLSDADLLLQSVIDKKKNHLFISNSKNNILISINELNNLKPNNIWVFYLLKEFGFSRENSDAICLLLKDKNDNIGKKFSSLDHELLIDRNNLIIRKIFKKPISYKVQILVNQHKIEVPISMTMESHKNTPEFIFGRGNTVAYFNLDKLIFPLTIRTWQVGDRIIPFGMNGSKLVSDILIDNKVNSFDKENTYVLLSGNKIIWVIGYRASNETRVKKSTKDIYVVSLEDSDLGN